MKKRTYYGIKESVANISTDIFVETKQIEQMDNDVFSMFSDFINHFKDHKELDSRSLFFYKNGIKVSVKIEDDVEE